MSLLNTARNRSRTPRGWLSLVLMVAIASLGMAPAQPVAAQEFKVIVNSANPISELSSNTVARLFLKEASNFPGGGPATPVEPAKSSAVRAAFAKAILGLTVQNLDTYWQQQIFSGRDVPPASKGSDDDVVAFVRTNPGAIGYVAATAATPGVKVITVN
jgi:ABC-type phosphate transport system substrate-binding protein